MVLWLQKQFPLQYNNFSNLYHYILIKSIFKHLIFIWKLPQHPLMTDPLLAL